MGSEMRAGNGASRSGRRRALRVFISSASGALMAYRQAAVEVCHRLGHQPVFMEEFDPQRPPPEQVCRAKVEGCDVFVLLLAHRYGSRPPGRDLSYTELEYQWAVEHPDMGLLVFVVDPAFAWPPPDIDRGPDAEALARLVAEVEARHLVKRLAEIMLFREDLIFALSPDQFALPAEPTEEADTREPQPKSRPPAFHAVPSYVGSAPFTGRSGHLAELDGWGRSAKPIMVVEAIGGTGKSALTWQWAQDRAPAVVDGLAGRLWWSFYDGSASMTRFLQELLAYTTGRPMNQIRQLERTSLADQVIAELQRQPYLVILDGFERLLAAYHQFDPSKLRDEEVEPDKRSLIEPHAEDIVRRLTTVGPSKILISTRLVPLALYSRFGVLMPGVRHLRLPGLSDSDTRALLARLDVNGSETAIAGFFGSLGNHPLLVGIVAGLVRDYRAEPGGFDRWLADPTSGAVLGVPDLNLTQRRSHILAAGLDGLSAGSQRLLGWISVLPGTVRWEILAAINPFRPEPPAPVQPDLSSLPPLPDPFDYRLPPFDSALLQPVSYIESPRREYEETGDDDREDYERQRWQWEAAAERIRAQAEQATRQQLAAWSTSEPVMRAKAQLDAALKDLENRGLLWWDRSSNTYDLHPIIRAFAHEQLADTDRVQANDRIRDHFQAMPPEDPNRAASVEDLTQTITIFRALMGAEHLNDAGRFWGQLSHALLVDIGAYSTVIELLALGPLATSGTSAARTDLGIAYSFVNRHDEAISQETGFLAEILQNADVGKIDLSISRLATYFWVSGALIATDRCLELREAIATASGKQPDGGVVHDRAVQALWRGQIEYGRDLIERAESLGSPAYRPWFEGNLQTTRLRLAFIADRSLTEAQLSAAATTVRSWRGRRTIAELRCQLAIHDGQLEQALTASEEHDQLCRNAGLDVAPARTAFILARLGRTPEAAAFVEDALIRLPRIHSADQPHYDLARALRELGHHTEAASHARHAYQQAWADGPPNSRYWDLRDASELLRTMNEPIPDLPVIDPASVKIPLEDEIRAVIAEIESVHRSSPEPPEW
jgi:tetratricopeptide (TPR) repeat protein